MTAVDFADPVALAVALLDDPNNVALFDSLWDSCGGNAATFSHALVAAQQVRRDRAREVDAGAIPWPVRTASIRRGSVPPAAAPAPPRRGPRHGAVATGSHAHPPVRASHGDRLLFAGSVLCAAVIVLQLVFHARWR